MTRRTGLWALRNSSELLSCHRVRTLVSISSLQSTPNIIAINPVEPTYAQPIVLNRMGGCDNLEVFDVGEVGVCGLQASQTEFDGWTFVWWEWKRDWPSGTVRENLLTFVTRCLVPLLSTFVQPCHDGRSRVGLVLSHCDHCGGVDFASSGRRCKAYSRRLSKCQAQGTQQGSPWMYLNLFCQTQPG